MLAFTDCLVAVIWVDEGQVQSTRQIKRDEPEREATGRRISELDLHCGACLALLCDR